MKTVSNAIVYLVQNRPFTTKNRLGLSREKVKNRLDLFYISLRYLFDALSPHEEPFDILIFHEGDVTHVQQQKIRKIIPRSISVFFETVKFSIPSWFREKVILDSVEASPIKSWRDIGYRHMCRFYAVQVYPLLLKKGYTKMMRLDDDSFLLQNLEPLFHLVTHDTPFYCRLFQHENVLYAQNYYQVFCQFLLKHGLSCPPEESSFYHVPFNNFFLLDLTLYTQPRVIDFLDYIDHHGGIYLYRWGDALLQGTMLKYICQVKIQQLDFQYSKWLIVHDPLLVYEYYQDSPTTTAPVWPLLFCLVVLICLSILAFFVYTPI